MIKGNLKAQDGLVGRRRGKLTIQKRHSQQSEDCLTMKWEVQEDKAVRVNRSIKKKKKMWIRIKKENIRIVLNIKSFIILNIFSIKNTKSVMMVSSF